MVQLIRNRLAASTIKLDPRLLLLALAALAAMVAVGTVFYLWRDEGSFRPLYGAGENYPAAEIMQVLDAEGIRYNLHPLSGQVLVRADQLGQARMLLAAKGVQAAVPAGYELFDKDEPLGTSQFVQDVRLKRSLEGELARSIMALKGVDMARVHLVLQENSSFVVSKREPAKASVVLQVTPGYKLKPEQVGAIVNLVANSVPQLAPGDISVVDQQGVLLSHGLNDMGGTAHGLDMANSYQIQVASNVEEVLAPILGAGN
ncbi:MAG TPA: flagellar basal-body MS-ring/collar protein FliF, partial [Dongiaceae bacterium]|nr:flagellar basal-body MS-ring/collar protein FliF [Dongiaceae bacterium]